LRRTNHEQTAASRTATHDPLHRVSWSFISSTQCINIIQSNCCSSSRVAEKLAKDLHGRIKVEDAGFDWKILGPDVSQLDFVASVCDQDAYACSGQKCSAQSLLFAHQRWAKAGIYEKLAELAGRRKLDDLTVGPVLTWTTEAMLVRNP
jgi:hypothetical protein